MTSDMPMPPEFADWFENACCGWIPAVLGRKECKEWLKYRPLFLEPEEAWRREEIRRAFFGTLSFHERAAILG